MIVDLTGAPPAPSPDQAAKWASSQRVFISSAMLDTGPHRKAVAQVVRDMGATPIWFEEFGGRDQDSEQAYLSEVDACTIYLSIHLERYGRRLPEGYSATEAEYHRAIDGGKRVSAWIAEEAPDRDGNLVRFITDLRAFHVTGSFDSPEDLAARVHRRLLNIAAQDLSPWVKLDAFMFRVQEIVQVADRITLRSSVNPRILRDIELLTRPVRLASPLGVAEGEFEGVERRLQAGGAPEVSIQLHRMSAPRPDTMRAGTTGYSAEDLLEVGLRNVLFGEPMPAAVAGLGFLADPGLALDDLRTLFDLPEEVAEPVARIFFADALLGGGKASAIINFGVGPKRGNERQLRLGWEDPRVYTNVAPGFRAISGSWRVQ